MVHERNNPTSDTMVLIADSGSTKTDWCLVSAKGEYRTLQTKGLNPFFLSTLDISKEISLHLMPELGNADIRAVYFYGAGCTPERSSTVSDALLQHFEGPCYVDTDMLGAARALCGDQPGIACILGTGANSCAYNGKEIIANVPPLGFILGDEGSGAVMGRLFLGALLKNQCAPGIKELFLDHYHLSIPEILDRIYRQPMPNRFLASFTPFMRDHIDDPMIGKIVINAFVKFIRFNVCQYEKVSELPIHFVGSIAYFFEAQLTEALGLTGLTLGKILRAPMDGLIDYHTSK